MSTGIGTVTRPGRAVRRGPSGQAVQVMLIIGIALALIGILVALPEATVMPRGELTATGTSDVDARWMPKWRAAASWATADVPSIGDMRWGVKVGRAGARPGS